MWNITFFPRGLYGVDRKRRNVEFELRHLNGVDYEVVGMHVLMVVGVGIYVARLSKLTGDYFKGGGRIPWRTGPP